MALSHNIEDVLMQNSKLCLFLKLLKTGYFFITIITIYECPFNATCNVCVLLSK